MDRVGSDQDGVGLALVREIRTLMFYELKWFRACLIV